MESFWTSQLLPLHFHTNQKNLPSETEKFKLFSTLQHPVTLQGAHGCSVGMKGTRCPFWNKQQILRSVPVCCRSTPLAVGEMQRGSCMAPADFVGPAWPQLSLALPLAQVCPARHPQPYAAQRTQGLLCSSVSRSV